MVKYAAYTFELTYASSSVSVYPGYNGMKCIHTQTLQYFRTVLSLRYACEKMKQRASAIAYDFGPEKLVGLGNHQGAEAQQSSRPQR